MVEVSIAFRQTDVVAEVETKTNSHTFATTWMCCKPYMTCALNVHCYEQVQHARGIKTHWRSSALALAAGKLLVSCQWHRTAVSASIGHLSSCRLRSKEGHGRDLGIALLVVQENHMAIHW